MEQVGDLLDVVKGAVDNESTDAEYLAKVRKLGYRVGETSALSLYKRIWDLTEDNRNGLWVPILKNNFAQSTHGTSTDFVIRENTPWISWPSMAGYGEL